MHEERGRAEEKRVAKWSVAKTLRVMGRVEEALGIQRALLNEFDRAGERSGYVYEELGECLLALGGPDEAAGSFAIAYQELAKNGFLVATNLAASRGSRNSEKPLQLALKGSHN